MQDNVSANGAFVATMGPWQIKTARTRNVLNRSGIELEELLHVGDA
jgi:hypothetical protein